MAFLGISGWILIALMTAVSASSQSRRTRLRQQKTTFGLDATSPQQRSISSFILPSNLRPRDDVKPAKSLVRPMPFDPRRTWQTFLRHSERAEIQQRRKTRKRLKSGRRFLQGLSGPPGPTGPRGPRGPPGANVTKQELMREFRDIVREAAERKAQQVLDPNCTISCKPILQANATGPYVPALFDVDQTSIIPRIPTAFLWRLTEDHNVVKKTFVELKHFHQPFAGGAFQRGEQLIPEGGRFNVSRSGLYTLFVNLHLEHNKLNPKKKYPHPQEIVTVLVCIDSLCQKNLSIEMTVGLLFPFRKQTIFVSGILYIEDGHYASVFVDNNSRFNLKISAGSQFSGYLAGI